MFTYIYICIQYMNNSEQYIPLILQLYLFPQVFFVHVPMNKVVLQFGIAQLVHTTPGSWFQPLWKIFVNGKDYSIYEMENKIHVWNHQPNIIMGVIPWISYHTHKNILISLAFMDVDDDKMPSNEQFAMESMDFQWSTLLHFGLSISFCYPLVN